ncbi:MAG: Flp family type IVb pilin [Gammaproteobacteria bacterium]
MSMISRIAAFVREEEGLTIVEYAIAGSLVAAGTVTLFMTLGDNVCNSIETLGNAVTGSAVVGAGGC